MQGEEAANVTAEGLREALQQDLAALGFHVEASSRGIWAARQWQRRAGLLGGSATTYCLTCIIDDRHLAIHVWDALLQRRWGLLRCWRGTSAQAVAKESRSALLASAQAAGWKLVFGCGSDQNHATRIFSA